MIHSMLFLVSVVASSMIKLSLAQYSDSIAVITPLSGSVINSGDVFNVSWIFNPNGNQNIKGENVLAVTLINLPGGDPKAGKPAGVISHLRADTTSYNITMPTNVTSGTYAIAMILNTHYFSSPSFTVNGAGAGASGASSTPSPATSVNNIPPPPPVIPSPAIPSSSNSSSSTNNPATSNNTASGSSLNSGSKASSPNAKGPNSLTKNSAPANILSLDKSIEAKTNTPAGAAEDSLMNNALPVFTCSLMTAFGLPFAAALLL